jgi:anti-sigma B factor antagonist
MITFDTSRAEDALVLAVSGEVDLDTADKLREAVLDTFSEHPKSVRVDLTGVSFLNSSGLNALLAGLKRAEEDGIPYAVVNAQPDVHKVIEMVGLADVLGA